MLGAIYPDVFASPQSREASHQLDPVLPRRRRTRSSRPRRAGFPHVAATHSCHPTPLAGTAHTLTKRGDRNSRSDVQDMSLPEAQSINRSPARGDEEEEETLMSTAIPQEHSTGLSARLTARGPATVTRRTASVDSPAPAPRPRLQSGNTLGCWSFEVASRTIWQAACTPISPRTPSGVAQRPDYALVA